MRQKFFDLATSMLTLSRTIKRLIVVLVDICICVLTVWIAFYLRLGEFIPFSRLPFLSVGLSIFIALPIFIFSGLYRAIFRYSGYSALSSVIWAVAIYTIIYSTIFTVMGVPNVPRTIGIIQPGLLLFFIGASRVFAHLWLSEQYRNITKSVVRSRMLIYGAGATGRQLVAAMLLSKEIQIAGFLDDDNRLHGHVLNGLKIYNPAHLDDLVPALKVSDVLLAMPNISRKRRSKILDGIRKVPVAVRAMPSMTDIAQGKIGVSDLRELDIYDLLGREPVAPNDALLAKDIRSKVIMVTGAGGSIGSELCRQIINVSPRALLLIDHSEFALYKIHEELKSKHLGDITLVPMLASVHDLERMREIMVTWNPNTIYHSAAYKHVPLVEHNVTEGMKNNVLGTLRTAQAAAETGVSSFVLISTDKAVRPTNIMGASKRLAEMILQALATETSATKFSMVRFGNVLGSSGSVVPKFRQQIQTGGPITVTDPRIVRYFMTIREASQLVIQAGAMAQGGDVFVLDMGEPIKIIELARRMVELSGLSVKDNSNSDGDIEVKTTGLRPGEKLYEELLIGNNTEATLHPKIIKADENFIPWRDLQDHLSAIERALRSNDVNLLREIIEELVTDFKPDDEIVDWVYKQKFFRNRNVF